MSAIAEIANRLQQARNALERCEAQFNFYAEEHAKKARDQAQLGAVKEYTASLRKSETNLQFAKMCKEARDG